MNSNFSMHVPVMLTEVMALLALKPGDTAVDATLGGGGYTQAMAQAVGGSGKIIAIDADELAIENFRLKVKGKRPARNASRSEAGGSKVTLVHENFRNLKEVIAKHELEKVNGIVFDLGLSSDQLQDERRGFSFALAAPLDMKFGREGTATEEIVNKWDIEKLRETIRNYGEERLAGRIARAIVAHRPLTTTRQLADVVVNAVPKNYERGRLHPATRTFQALRIATNDELQALQAALPAALDALQPGGRVVVVSFHSLEDRIAKRAFRGAAREGLIAILTKKPLTPAAAEVQKNPRSRSAKLRAVERL